MTDTTVRDHRDSGAAKPPALATPDFCPPPSLDRTDPEEFRRPRWKRRRTLWRWSNSSTRANCGRLARSTDVELVATQDEDGQKRGHVRGAIACRSIWACPVCSAMIRKGRQEELQAAASEWERRGGQVRLLTLTMRHKKGEELRHLLDALYESWRRTSRGRPWEKRLERYGVRYWARAAEVTYGEANGWHPHLHIVLFMGFDMVGPLLEGEERRIIFGGHLESVDGNGKPEHFRHWLEARWLRGLEALGRSAAKGIGLDLRRIGAEATGYIIADEDAKTANKVALEAMRGDLKSARGDRITPFQLLDDRDSDEAFILWHEYEVATAGRKLMGRSATLLEDMGVVEATDEELTQQDAADDEGTDELHADKLPAIDWRKLCDADLDHAAVVAYGFGGLEPVLELLRQLGVVPERDEATVALEPLVIPDASSFPNSEAVEYLEGRLARAARRVALDLAADRLVAWAAGGDQCAKR